MKVIIKIVNIQKASLRFQKRFLENFIYIPYKKITQYNSSYYTEILANSILSVYDYGFKSLIFLISELLVIIFLSTFLCYKEPKTFFLNVCGWNKYSFNKKENVALYI